MRISFRLFSFALWVMCTSCAPETKAQSLVIQINYKGFNFMMKE